jgi:hypothetical protein
MYCIVTAGLSVTKVLRDLEVTLKRPSGVGVDDAPDESGQRFTRVPELLKTSRCCSERSMTTFVHCFVGGCGTTVVAGVEGVEGAVATAALAGAAMLKLELQSRRADRT